MCGNIARVAYLFT